MLRGSLILCPRGVLISHFLLRAILIWIVIYCWALLLCKWFEIDWIKIYSKVVSYEIDKFGPKAYCVTFKLCYQQLPQNVTFQLYALLLFIVNYLVEHRPAIPPQWLFCAVHRTLSIETKVFCFHGPPRHICHCDQLHQMSIKKIETLLTSNVYIQILAHGKIVDSRPKFFRHWLNLCHDWLKIGHVVRLLRFDWKIRRVECRETCFCCLISCLGLLCDVV